MATSKKIVATTVAEIVEELKANPSKRFSKSDYQTLVFGVLSDKNFKAKKYLLRNDGIVEEETNYNQAMNKFLDKLLKHAGMSSPAEREAVLDSFEFSSKDMEWIIDAVDEAMWIYSECDKNVRIFRDKMLQLTVKKMVRSGKYNGKVTYKKMVLDRAAALEKKKK